METVGLKNRDSAGHKNEDSETKDGDTDGMEWMERMETVGHRNELSGTLKWRRWDIHMETAEHKKKRQWDIIN